MGYNVGVREGRGWKDHGGAEHGAPMPVCTRAVIARPPPRSVSTQGNSPHARHVMEAVVRAAWMTQPCLSPIPGTMTSRK